MSVQWLLQDLALLEIIPSFSDTLERRLSGVSSSTDFSDKEGEVKGAKGQ